MFVNVKIEIPMTEFNRNNRRLSQECINKMISEYNKNIPIVLHPETGSPYPIGVADIYGYENESFIGEGKLWQFGLSLSDVELDGDTIKSCSIDSIDLCYNSWMKRRNSNDC